MYELRKVSSPYLSECVMLMVTTIWILRGYSVKYLATVFLFWSRALKASLKRGPSIEQNSGENGMQKVRDVDNKEKDGKWWPFYDIIRKDDLYKRQHKGNCKVFSEMVVQIEADENVKFSCDYKVEFRVLQATLKGWREQMRELCQIFSPKETTNHRCGGKWTQVTK